MAAQEPLSQRKQNLWMVLSGLFIANALLAEVIGPKIFSAEKTLGLAPAQIPMLGGLHLDFNLTAGVIIWPVVFITSDIINEYFGKAGVRRISYLAAALIAYAFLAIWGVTLLSPADFWLDVNKSQSTAGDFDINLAFSLIFRQGLGIIIGSLTAFLIGQLLDASVFHWLKLRTGSSKIWLRATGSTLVSQFVDSFVVLGIAFWVFGNWSLEQLISVGCINYLYKATVALVLTPTLYLAHNLIDCYLGEKASEVMVEKATEMN